MRRRAGGVQAIRTSGSCRPEWAALERQRIMHRFRQLWRYPLVRVGSVTALATLLLGSLAVVVFHPSATVKAASSCQLSSAGGDIQHVIHIQFDNTHFRRDNPNVPSDLEQMPHLLN